MNKTRRLKKSVPKRYIPFYLSKRDKEKQREMLKKSRKQYKKGEYFTRKRVSSFKSKESPHIKNVRKIYNIHILEDTVILSHVSK